MSIGIIQAHLNPFEYFYTYWQTTCYQYVKNEVLTMFTGSAAQKLEGKHFSVKA